MSKPPIKKTENSFVEDKIALRLSVLPDAHRINVLDAFSADMLLWNEIKKRSDRDINILRIEKRKDADGIYLPGDNLKYLSSIDLTQFDIVDLDSYGVPFKQLEILFKSKYSGIVVITFIQSLYGCLDRGMLVKLGYTKKMVEKCPSLFNRHGFLKMQQYLAMNGVAEIKFISHGSKHYAAFKT